MNAPDSQGVYSPRKALSQQRTLHYVVWLARQLEADGSNEFLIENLQSSCLGSVKQKRLYKMLLGLIVGLIAGLFYGLIAGQNETIKLTEQLKLSWKKTIFGLTWGLIANQIYRLIRGGPLNPISLMFSMLMFALILGLSDFKIENKTIPNQGVWNSVTNAGIVALIGGLIGGLIFGVYGKLNDKPIFGLAGGLIGGLACVLILGLIFELSGMRKVGGYAVIQHVTLRLILCYNGYIPWNYAQFLDRAVKHRFIQRIGGRYRFMHDLLRKHFAQMPFN